MHEKQQKYLSCFCLMKNMASLQHGNAPHLMAAARDRIMSLYRHEYEAILGNMKQQQLQLNQLNELWLIDEFNKGALC